MTTYIAGERPEEGYNQISFTPTQGTIDLGSIDLSAIHPAYMDNRKPYIAPPRKTLFGLTEVNISPIIYDVMIEDELVNGAGEEIQGQIDTAEAKIRINDHVAPSVKIQVLWHEILHGILEQAGYIEHDEGVVESIAYGLMRVMRDNPELVEITTSK